MRFRCEDGTAWNDLPLDKLRVCLQGDPPLVPQLYEALFLHCLRVDLRLMAGEQVLGGCELRPEEGVAQVGLNLDEGLLPFPPQVFPGFRHLIELQSFPGKYSFVDLLGWHSLRERVLDRRGNTVEVVLHFSRSHLSLERGLTEDNLVLGCTPIVNLFSKSAEPVQLNHRESKQWVIPSRNQATGHEVYMIEEVHLLDPEQRRHGLLRPFYDSTIDAPDSMGYWLATRRAATWQDDAGVALPGTEIDLHVVDQRLEVHRPTNAILDVQALCCNRDLPSKWQRGGDLLALASETALTVPVHAILRGEPTRPLRPPLRHATFWRLLSQNALNHVALAPASIFKEDGKAGGQQALQELLRLCDFSEPDSQWANVVQQFIDGIVSVRSRPRQWPISSGKNLGYCRGQEVEVELDESKYSSIGALVFASVLERFLSLYTGINSFVQMVLKTTQSKDIVKRWKPRSAEQVLP